MVIPVAKSQTKQFNHNPIGAKRRFFTVLVAKKDFYNIVNSG